MTPYSALIEQVEHVRTLPLAEQVVEHQRLEHAIFARVADLTHHTEPGVQRDAELAAAWAEHAELKKQHPVFEGVPAAWLRTPEEFVDMDFEEVSWNGSHSPKRTFETDPEEVWTLRDAVADDHIEMLGDPRRRVLDGSVASTAHLRPAILADEPITVYRAISDGRYDTGPIIPGSFVTESRDYAVQHGEHVLADAGDTPGWRIDSMQVRPSELAASGLHEFNWHPKDPGAAHRQIVETAIAQGYYVPDHVLAHYPDLAERATA